MNIKQLVLSSIGISALFVTAMTIDPTPNIRKSKESQEHEKIAGARAYDLMLRGNQMTHTIDPKDVYAVQQEIRDLQKLQNKKTRAFSTIKWEEMGPNNVGGRTRALLSDKDSSNKLYMGGVNGGLFVSHDHGSSWVKIASTDSNFNQTISSICQAANGDIYFGTGEGFYMGSGEFGRGQLGSGVYKSTDGGNTFQRLTATIPTSSNSAGNWSYINKLVADPTDPNKIYAGVQGGLWVTTNGGANWSKPATLNVSGLFNDIEVSSDGSRVIASTSTNVYISNDGGATFGANIMGTSGSGLPSGSAINRIELGMAPSNKDVMYIATVRASDESLEGCYKTSDGGNTWTKILAGGSSFGASDVLGFQGTYDIALGVHPTNPDLLFLGGQFNMYRYTPGTGTNQGWIPIAFWLGNAFTGDEVHADMHGVVFNKANPEEMYVICDGGFYRTQNSSDVNPFFTEKNKNYITSQPYGVSANYLGHFIIGCQDNGSWKVGDETNSNRTGRSLLGGDGTRNWMSDLKPEIVFASIIEGELKRAGDGGQNGASFNSIFDLNMDAKTPGLSGTNPDDLPDDNSEWTQWVMPIDVKEAKLDSIPRANLVCGTNKNIWLTQDALSNNPIWFRLTNGLNGTQGVSISAVTIAPDGKTIFAGTSNGFVYRLKVPDLWGAKYKYADTVTNTDPAFNFPLKSQIVVKPILNIGIAGRVVTDLECDQTGTNLVVTLGNYGNSNYVFGSSNAQDSIPTFNVIDGNLPNMPVYSAIMVEGNPQKIMLGTEFGIWGSTNGGSTWEELNSMDKTQPTTWHPRTAVYEIIQKKNMWLTDQAQTGYFQGSSIFTASHGRGVFRTTSLTTPVNFAVPTSNVEKNLKLDVYPNPTTNDLHLNFQTDKAGTIIIRVLTLNGVTVKTITKTVVSGSNTLDLNTNELSSGAYLIAITDGQRKASASFVKH